MSESDIERALSLLSSSKMRERSEGLKFYESFSTSNIQLSPKRLKQLVQGLLNLIQNELHAFKNSKTASTADRLERSSNSLRYLITKFFDNNHTPKHKLRSEIVYFVIDSFDHEYVMNTFFVDLTKSVTMIIDSAVFRDHMSESDWLKVYEFLISALEYLISYRQFENQDTTHLDGLVFELFKSFERFMSCSVQLTISYIPLLLEGRYKAVITLVQKASSLYKRENTLSLNLFRIVNKILIVLSTEDEKAIVVLIKIGLEFVLRFHLSQLESMQAQIAVFLNLFLTMDLPFYLVKDVNPVSLSDESEVDQVCYAIQAVIDLFFSQQMSSTGQLTDDDINIIDNEFPTDWFSLTTIELKTNKHLTWMSYLGVSGLLSAYYRLKEIADSAKVASYSSIFMSGCKRRKSDGVIKFLRESSTVLEFLSILIKNHTNKSVKKLALQVLIFYTQTQNKGGSSTRSRESSNISTDNGTIMNRKNNIVTGFKESSDPTIKAIISTQNEKSVIFWTMLSLKCLVESHMINGNSKMSRDQVNQILNLSLHYVKDSTLSNITSVLVYDLISMTIRLNKSEKIEKTFVSLLENLVDFPVIYGPHTISDASFVFWYALADVLQYVSSPKKRIVGVKIQEWLVSKWEYSFNGDSTDYGCVRGFPEFLAWLCGAEAKGFKSERQSMRGSVLCTLSEYLYLYDQRCELRNFISGSQEEREKMTCNVYRPISPLGARIEESLLQKLLAHQLSFTPRQDAIGQINWTFLCLKLIELLQDEPIMSNFISSLETQCALTLSNLSPSNLSQDIFFKAVNTVNEFSNFDLSQKGLLIFANSFPFHAFIRRLNDESRLFSLTNSDLTSKSPLELEFHGTDGAPFTSETNFSAFDNYSSLGYCQISSVTYFKFLLVYESFRNPQVSEKFNTYTHYLKTLNPKELLCCYATLLDEISEQRIGIYDIPAERLITLTRLLGEGPLSDSNLERSELTINVVCRYLQFVIPRSYCENNVDLKNDVTDICKWIMECSDKGYVITELSSTQFLKLVLTLLRTRAISEAEKGDLYQRFLERFGKITNSVKVNLKDFITRLFKESTLPNQVKMYKDIVLRFENPTNSKVSASTYALFLCDLARSSRTVFTAALINLLECFDSEVFTPYLKLSIMIMNRQSGFPSKQLLFNTYKLEIFKHWWLHNSFDLFPWELFDYKDKSDFWKQNCTEICAVAIAFSNNIKRDNFIEKLLITGDSTDEIVYSSIPRAIALSYTKGGIRDKVFDFVGSATGDSVKHVLSSILSLIVLRIIEHLDLSNEEKLLCQFKNSSATNRFKTGTDVGIIELPLESTISLESGLALLDACTTKASLKSSYWGDKEIYFLMRKILCSLSSTSSLDDKKIVIRKLKLLMLLKEKDSYTFAFMNLIIRSLCNWGLTSSSRKNTLMFMLGFKSDLKNLSKSEGSITLIADFISALLKHDVNLSKDCPELQSTLLAVIERYPNHSNLRRTLQEATLMLSRKNVEPTSLSIEKLLDDATQLNLITAKNNTSNIVTIISKLFNHIKVFNDHGNKEPVVKFLVNLDEKSLERANGVFSRWCANYISNYYLSGGFERGAGHIVHLEEFSSDWVDNMEQSLSSLKVLLNIVLEFSSKLGDDNIYSVIENIIGVLLWNCETDKCVSYSWFNEYYDLYSGYILPVNYSTNLVLRLTTSQNYFSTSMTKLPEFTLECLSSGLFEHWICNTAGLLIQESAKVSSIAILFLNITKEYPTLATQLFPFLICYLLNSSPSSYSQQITDTLHKIVDHSDTDIRFSTCLVNTSLILRFGARRNLKDLSLLYESLLSVKLINHAVTTKRFKTALLFLEDQCSGSDLRWDVMRETLASIFNGLEDYDLTYGLPAEADLQNAIDAFKRENEGHNVLTYSNAIFEAQSMLASTYSIEDIMHPLMENGLMGISKLVSESSYATNDDFSYQWAWKLGNWELPRSRGSYEYHTKVYDFLRQLHDYPSKALEISDNFLTEMYSQKSELMASCLGSTNDIVNKLFSWLKILGTVKSISEAVSTIIGNDRNMLSIYSKKTAWFEFSDNDVPEDIISARNSVFLMFGTPEVTSELDIATENPWLCSLSELVRYTSLSRASNQLQKMINSTLLIDRISKSKFRLAKSSISQSVSNLAKYQSAITLWHSGVTTTPVAILKALNDNYDTAPLKGLSPSKEYIVATLVKWMAESRQELPENLMHKYVMPTVYVMENTSDLRQDAEVYQNFARFCESQHNSRTMKEEHEKLSKRIELKKKEIEELKEHYGKRSVDSQEKKKAQKYYTRLKASLASEQKNFQALLETMNVFSSKCIEFYLKCITIDENNEEDTSKFIVLWLEQSARDDINLTIRSDFLSLPTWKLAEWCTQLTSRLSNKTNEFQRLLQILLFNLFSDHPYHSLYNLVSLRIHELQDDGKNENERGKAVEFLWNKLLTSNNIYVTTIFVPISRFCEESLKLSEMKVSRGRIVNLKKHNLGSYWLDELPQIPPPTLALSVDKSKNYEYVPVFERIKNEVSIASSGLSLPKIASFTLSNANCHKILFKHGSDDLRQDSVMEQVFERVNKFFVGDNLTRRRKLRMRTYKVVPLGPQAGVLEFVPNSIALLDVVKPYHDTIDAMKLDKAREIMKDHQSFDAISRLGAYQKIETKVKPVLRFFFFKEFLYPDKWFDTRINYTRGTAAASIVGHVLGLGDRHCNNVLIDKTTGEPIHIDLGVAFDQGKMLPIPETVPFRLTRDIVDGFGVTDVNGVFKRSCEQTFRVLREHKDQILAFLDVLRWDPLYSWTLSPLRKKKLQNEATEFEIMKIEEDGSEAGRAISTVSDKLIAGNLSNEAVVREVIHEAGNPQNLALVYFGWCPFY